MSTIHKKGCARLEILREVHRAESEWLLDVFGDVLDGVREALLAVLVAERSEMAVNGHRRIQMTTSGSGNRSKGVAVSLGSGAISGRPVRLLTRVRATFNFR